MPAPAMKLLQVMWRGMPAASGDDPIRNIPDWRAHHQHHPKGSDHVPDRDVPRTAPRADSSRIPDRAVHGGGNHAGAGSGAGSAPARAATADPHIIRRRDDSGPTPGIVRPMAAGWNAPRSSSRLAPARPSRRSYCCRGSTIQAASQLACWMRPASWIDTPWRLRYATRPPIIATRTPTRMRPSRRRRPRGTGGEGRRAS